MQNLEKQEIETKLIRQELDKACFQHAWPVDSL